MKPGSEVTARLAAALILIPCLAAGGEPVRVRRGDLAEVLTVNGSITAGRGERYAAPAIPRAWTMQISWLIEDGTPVAPGDTLVELDPSTLAADLAQARASLEEKRQLRRLREAELERSRVDTRLELRQAEIHRRQAELEAGVPEAVLSAREYSEKQLERERAARAHEEALLRMAGQETAVGTELQQIDIEIAELEGSVRRTEKAIADMTLRARAPGVALIGLNERTDRPLQAGDSVWRYEALLVTPDPSSLEVEAWVNEIDLGRVSVGMGASLRLDAYPERAMSGRVTEVAAIAESRDHWGAPHHRLRVALDRPEPELMRPGMSVQCELTVAHHRGVLLVPISHVQVHDGVLWVKPVGRQPVEVEATAVAELDLAVAADGGLGEGAELEPPAPTWLAEPR